MANCPGSDLPDGRSAARQTRGVVVRGKIADQSGGTMGALEQRKRFLEKGRLAGAGARYQANHKDPGLLKAHAQSARDFIVVLENVAPDLDNSRARNGAHAANSSADTSNSRPSTFSITRWQSDRLLSSLASS